jgi:hypothetical protein
MAEKGTDVTVTRNPLTEGPPINATPTAAAETVTGTGLKRAVYDLLIATPAYAPIPFPTVGSSKPASIFTGLPIESPTPVGTRTQEDIYVLIPAVAKSRVGTLNAAADIANSLVEGQTSVKEFCQLSNTATGDQNTGNHLADFWGTLITNTNLTVFSSDNEGITVLRDGRYLISCSMFFDGSVIGQMIQMRVNINGVFGTTLSRTFGQGRVNDVTPTDNFSVQIPALPIVLSAGDKVGITISPVGPAGVVSGSADWGHLSVVEL